MSLKDYNWRGYYPGDHDHLNQIFIPALQHSIRYDRITGAFSSAVLTLLAAGLKTFIEAGGKIRLIPGARLYQADVEAIERGEAELVANHIDWDELAEGQPEVVREALAWLVANDILEVRIGVVADETGRVQPIEAAEWHQKVAIFSDSGGNAISYVGSPNESFKAFKRNRESVDLNRSWITNPADDWDQARKIRAHKEEFQALWDDQDLSARVYSVPDALREQIIQYYPDAEPDWNDIFQTLRRRSLTERLPKPRSYQREAIETLTRNNSRLILKHATGTGKTWTALFALRRITEGSDVVVILAPKKDLLRQWSSPAANNLSLFFPESNIITCTGDHDWRRSLYNALSTSRSEPLFVLATMHPSTMSDVVELIASSTNSDKLILVADEVHNLGAEAASRILSSFHAQKARLGLSATPFRGDQGDATIAAYFSDQLHEVTLHDAIYKYEVLSRYSYHLHTVAMSHDERHRYNDLSDDIIRLYLKLRDSEQDPIMAVADCNPRLQALIQTRASIHKECDAKTPATSRILDSVGKKTMIFANTVAHARRVAEAIAPSTSRTLAIYHGSLGANERRHFLKLFEDGPIDTLVSIDCLTEGVNIPQCDSAILITNSTSEREAIQRRGRVLRKVEGGDVAKIHDFAVLPVDETSFLAGSESLSDHELRMVNRELDRATRMAEAAENSLACETMMFRLRKATRMY